MPYSERTCVQCGKSFPVYLTKAGKESKPQMFCDLSCRALAGGHTGNYSFKKRSDILAELPWKEDKPVYTITLYPYADHGFRFEFPFDRETIDRLKLCLGAVWKKSLKSWVAEGPEVLLDLERFQVPYVPGNAEAERRIAEFTGQIERIVALKRRENGSDGERFSYQKVGTELLMTQISGILGDEMGLGKSKQALEAARNAGARDILVVALNSILYKWAAEVTKWWPEAEAIVIPNDAAGRAEALDKMALPPGETPRVFIANYEKVWRDWWPERDWDVLIFDEATRVKNRKSLSHATMAKIAQRSLMVMAITGTPLETHPEELYGIFSVVRPSVFGNISRFREQHLEKVWDADSGRLIQRFIGKDVLRERFAPWFTRRTKDAVQSQLPPKLYTHLYFDLSPEEQKMYNRLASDSDDWLKSDDAIIRLIRFQQLTSSPRLLGEEPIGSKFRVLQEVLELWDGRALIFTRFREMALLLSEWLELPETAIIHGHIKDPAERLARLEQFNAGNLGKVFVATDALSHGMDVNADLVIHYDKLWNPAKEWQREDRCHGVGRGMEGRVTNVVYLLAKDTLDEGMQLATEYRANIIKEIIGEADNVMLKAFDAQDYKSMIRGRLRRGEG